MCLSFVDRRQRHIIFSISADKKLMRMIWEIHLKFFKLHLSAREYVFDIILLHMRRCITYISNFLSRSVIIFYTGLLCTFCKVSFCQHQKNFITRWTFLHTKRITFLRSPCCARYGSGIALNIISLLRYHALHCWKNLAILLSARLS